MFRKITLLRCASTGFSKGILPGESFPAKPTPGPEIPTPTPAKPVDASTIAKSIPQTTTVASQPLSNKAFVSSVIPDAPSLEPATHVVAPTALLRSLKLEEILNKATPMDIVLAKHEMGNCFTFQIFKNLAPEALCSKLLAFPVSQRTFHVVVGRQGIPADFYGDVDMDVLVKNPEESLFILLEATITELAERGFKNVEVHVLSGNATDKHSYHVHIRCPTMAFADYRDVLAVARAANDRSGLELGYDVAVYRDNATLRLAHASKLHNVDRILRPLDATYGPLKDLLATADQLPNAALVERSLIHRLDVQGQAVKQFAKENPEAAAEMTLPTKGTVKLFNSANFARKTGTVAADGTQLTATGKKKRATKMVEGENGELVPQSMAPQLKWKRYAEVRKKLFSMPDAYAKSYDTWVNVGLALHSFTEDGSRQPFEDFCDFSARCTLKFSRKTCADKWKVFKNPLNNGRREKVYCWRRGYYYLTRTIWRNNN